MSERENRKRKSKSWYRKQAFKQRKTDGKPGHRLIAGLKGFIITCNDRERDAVKESYNILNEYADKLYGPERKEEAGSDGESDEEDIEAAIAKEVQSLKEAATSGERRFQNSQTGAKNCIFIKTTLNDPVALAHAIFTDLRETKQQKSRHALRLLPVVGTCKASVKDISDLAKVVLQPYFTDTQFEVTFSINFKARNNNGVGREMTITTLRDTIMETFPSVLLRFTHTNPQITILVEVMCGVACIAVAKDFAHFRKYNLLEVIRDKPIEENSSVKSEDTSVQPVLSTEDNSKVKSEDTSVQPVLSTEDNNKVKSEDTSVQPVLSTEDNSSVQSKDASVKNFPSTEENSDVQREHASMEQTADNQDAAVLEGEHQEGSAIGSISEQSYSSCKDSESVSVKDTDREDGESVSVKDTDREDGESVSVKDTDREDGESVSVKDTDKEDSESVSVKDTDREDSESVSVKDTDREDGESVSVKDTDREDGESVSVKDTDKEDGESVSVKDTDREDGESVSVKDTDKEDGESVSVKDTDKEDGESVSVKDTDREDSESVSVKDTDREDSGSVPAKDAAK